MKLYFLLLLQFLLFHCRSQVKYLDSLFHVYNTATADTPLARSINLIAVYYLNHNLDSAQKYGELMYKLSEQKKLLRLQARSLFFFGDIQAKRNNISEQINYSKQALDLLTLVNDREGIAQCNNRMGALYASINDMQNARKHLDRFFEDTLCFKKGKRVYQISRANNTLGEICLSEKKYRKAVLFFKKAISQGLWAHQINWLLARMYYNLGRAYAGLGDYKSAVENYNTALEMNASESNTDGILSSKIALANVYAKTKMQANALVLLKESEIQIPKITDKKILLDYYQSYIILYDSLKNYKKKSDYLILRSDLKDNINFTSYNEKLAEAKTKFETEEKEKENQILFQKNQVQELKLKERNLMIAILIIGGTFFTLLVMLLINHMKLKNLQNTIKLEQKLLRSQINPHFLFNSLVSIESYIYCNEPQKAGSYLSNFSKLMRLILENSREEYITLEQEVKTLKYYLELQKLRFENKFEYSIAISDDLDIESTLIPPMLAQPFIENSIEHGLKQINEKGEIKISFSLKDGNLFFEVIDNGPGLQNKNLNEAVDKKNRSLATQITKERLKLFDKKRGTKTNIFVQDIKNTVNKVLGCKVVFVIPYKQSQTLSY